MGLRKRRLSELSAVEPSGGDDALARLSLAIAGFCSTTDSTTATETLRRPSLRCSRCDVGPRSLACRVLVHLFP